MYTKLAMWLPVWANIVPTELSNLRIRVFACQVQLRLITCLPATQPAVILENAYPDYSNCALNMLQPYPVHASSITADSTAALITSAQPAQHRRRKPTMLMVTHRNATGGLTFVY